MYIACLRYEILIRVVNIVFNERMVFIMSLDEINKEIRKCHDKVGKISEGLDNATCSEERIELVEDLISTADRISELKNMTRELFIEELRKGLVK